MTTKTGNDLFELIIALLLLSIAVGMLATAHTYSQSSGFFPKFIGWIFVMLALIEVLRQLMSIFATKEKETKESGDHLMREFTGFLWLAALLATLYVLGFLIATPVFIFSFLRISAGKSLRECLLVSGLGTVFVYVIFVVLLEYRLFAGVLFAA